MTLLGATLRAASRWGCFCLVRFLLRLSGIRAPLSAYLLSTYSVGITQSTYLR